MWTLAQRHSLGPLLNSLLLEWDQFHFEDNFIVIPHHTHPLNIELEKKSLLGHHQYTGNVYLGNEKLSFKEFLEVLARILELTPEFTARVMQSTSFVEEAITLNLSHFKDIKANFEHTETALFLGHSLHPAPKSRSQFSREDLKRFSPEHGGKFSLSWFYVHESIYFEEHSTNFKDHEWSEKTSSLKKIEGFHLFPMHPWQKENIFKLEVIKKYKENGLIIEAKEDHLKWTPTSSLRTIYCKDSPFMLKFSMDLKMTNSVRHLLIHELKRGIQIDEVIHHPSLKNFLLEFSEFKIIQEPLYAGILDENKKPLIPTLVMLRENPFTPSDEVALLATLNQPDVNIGASVLSKLLNNYNSNPLEWFSLFLKKAIKPFLVLQGEHGILLGAHQQNLILKLERGKPCGVYFRDCHGTGFEKNKVKVLKENIQIIEESNGNILEAPLAHYLFSYYLIINSVFNTISSLSKASDHSEVEFLNIFEKFLKDLKTRPELEVSFIDYLLHSPKLKHKGNFFCTVRDINENTSDNPLAIYTDISNPLQGVSL